MKQLMSLAILLTLTLLGGNWVSALTPEEIWQSLEKLPAAEREKKLVEGAKKEGEMVWYTNSGIENATRYIQGFKKKYPFIDANVWRSKTRQVTQRMSPKPTPANTWSTSSNHLLICCRSCSSAT